MEMERNSSGRSILADNQTSTAAPHQEHFTDDFTSFWVLFFRTYYVPDVMSDLENEDTVSSLRSKGVG